MKVINTYVGRFAPSPTGPLHFGSLVAALASYLDARKHQGQWLLRIEDIDPPRESLQSPGEILNQLRGFGLTWDGEPLFQSTRLEAYNRALERLRQKSLTFECSCSRRSFGAIYPGTCHKHPLNDGPTATKIKVGDSVVDFVDLFQGAQRFDLAAEMGDFTLQRKDGLIAYQLAVTVDDQFQDITHVIRGHDLLDSTPRQIYLAKTLSLPVPEYGHFPVVLGADGHKLSKQAKAEPVSLAEPMQLLNLALLALGQFTIEATDVEQLVKTATTQWQRSRVPTTKGVPFKSLSV